LELGGSSGHTGRLQLLLFAYTVSENAFTTFYCSKIPEFDDSLPLTEDGSGQGDQMSLLKNGPKCSRNHIFVKK
jgi:hypothetical protein